MIESGKKSSLWLDGTLMMAMAGLESSHLINMPAGNANTTRGFNRLSQKGKRRRARQQRSQSFNRSRS